MNGIGQHGAQCTKYSKTPRKAPRHCRKCDKVRVLRKYPTGWICRPCARVVDGAAWWTRNEEEGNFAAA